MAYMNLVISWLSCIPPTHLNHQYNFLVSGIFTPRVLWDTINKFFQCLEVLMMDRDLCYMIWFDNASSWSNLISGKTNNRWANWWRIGINYYYYYYYYYYHNTSGLFSRCYLILVFSFLICVNCLFIFRLDE